MSWFELHKKNVTMDPTLQNFLCLRMGIVLLVSVCLSPP